MSGKKRPRTEKRIEARTARKLVKLKQQLARLERGGSPEQPIIVPTPAVIGTKAASHPCPLCGGALRGQEQRAEVLGERRLRAINAVCQTCGAPNTLWFQIVPVLEN